MAETLKDSGSGVRPPMIGEYGWQGGVIAKAEHGLRSRRSAEGRAKSMWKHRRRAWRC